MAVQWLALLPHSKKVPASNLLGAGGFSLWSLRFLSVSAVVQLPPTVQGYAFGG